MVSNEITNGKYEKQTYKLRYLLARSLVKILQKWKILSTSDATTKHHMEKKQIRYQKILKW